MRKLLSSLFRSLSVSQVCQASQDYFVSKCALKKTYQTGKTLDIDVILKLRIAFKYDFEAQNNI